MRLPWRGNWRGERKVLFEKQCRMFYTYIIYIDCCMYTCTCSGICMYMYIVHACRRKEERSKQGQTNNKPKQYSTPKAVTFPRKTELPRVRLHVHCTCTVHVQLGIVIAITIINVTSSSLLPD